MILHCTVDTKTSFVMISWQNLLNSLLKRLSNKLKNIEFYCINLFMLWYLDRSKTSVRISASQQARPLSGDFQSLLARILLAVWHRSDRAECVGLVPHSKQDLCQEISKVSWQGFCLLCGTDRIELNASDELRMPYCKALPTNVDQLTVVFWRRRHTFLLVCDDFQHSKILLFSVSSSIEYFLIKIVLSLNNLC